MKEDDLVAVPLNIPADEFYNNGDSVYIRIQYVPDKDGYRFSIWNQYYINLEDKTEQGLDDQPFGATAMMVLARGLIDAAIQHPADIYDIGCAAVKRDYVNSTNDLTDSQRDLFNMEPSGNA